MKQSAGILLYKKKGEIPYFLLVHPGGPFWKNKDAGVWSIPKGEINENEDKLAAALREFEEETGIKLSSGNFQELEPVKLKSGKIVFAWALEGDLDTSQAKSNEFEMEWPPKSGMMKRFPEIDKAAWFSAEEAMEKINPAQQNFIVTCISKCLKNN